MAEQKKSKSQKPDTSVQETAASMESNVRLAAEAKPLGKGPVTVGDKVLCELPDADTQRAGFYCKEAERLVQLYPGRFKLIQTLGEES